MQERLLALGLVEKPVSERDRRRYELSVPEILTPPSPEILAVTGPDLRLFPGASHQEAAPGKREG